MIYFELILLALLEVAESWGCKAHQQSFDLAESLLPPSSIEEVKTILSESAIVNSHLIHLNSVRQSVCLPDVIKRKRKYRYTAPWHYYDIPYNYTHRTIPASLFDLSVENIYSAIENELYTLRTTDSLQEKGDALLFLLHFLSDMMQPMHVTQLVTDEYPNGDSGGLRYSLVGVSRFKNLHMLTDNPMIQNQTVEDLHYLCMQRDWYRLEPWNDDIVSLILESHQRGEVIYDILRNTHHPSIQQIHTIQLILSEALCRTASVLASFMQSFSPSLD
ncbi:hypothetical protein WA171_004986, partial [Blastocystis sp. BT1]